MMEFCLLTEMAPRVGLEPTSRSVGITDPLSLHAPNKIAP